MSGRPAGMSDDDSDSDDLSFSYSLPSSNRQTQSSYQNQEPEPKSQAQKMLNRITTNQPNNNKTQQQTLPPSIKSIDLDDVRMAAMKGNDGLVKQFLDKGLAADQVLKSGWTALMYAGSCGQSEAVKILLEAGADPNFHKDLYTAFMAVCASSHENEDALVKCAKLMLDKKALINAAERHRVTPLMFASKEGRLQLVRLLLRNGAECNSQDNKGWTALMWAANQGHGHVVRLLLENGADTKVVNTSGQTAADIALSARYPEVKDLLEGTISTVQSEKQTVIDYKSHLTSEVTELEMVLMGMELADLLPRFKEHSVNFYAFLCLTEEDLDRMGIEQVGVRVRLLQAIKEIHTREWKRSSLPALHYSKTISCPEAVSLVGSLAKQLRYMEASIAYLRIQLENKPRILELGQQAASLNDLSHHCEDSMRYTTGLQSQVKFLSTYLSKLQDKAEYVPADLIVEKPTKPEGRSWTRMLTFLVVSAVGCVVVWRTPRLLGKSVILITA